MLSGLVAISLIGHWLGLSAYRSLETISSEQSLLIFTPPFVLALACYILSPDRQEGEGVDLEAHYFSIARWVYGSLALFNVFGRVSDLMIPGQEPFPAWFSPLLAVLFLVPVFVSNARAHWAVLGTVVLAFAAASLS